MITPDVNAPMNALTFYRTVHAHDMALIIEDKDIKLFRFAHNDMCQSQLTSSCWESKKELSLRRSRSLFVV